MPIEIKIIRSGRKTMSLEITREAEVLIRAPYQTERSEIDRFVQEKADWIAAHLEKMQEKLEERKARPVKRMSREEIQALADKAPECCRQRWHIMRLPPG